MKTIKKLTAILSCIAVAGSLAATVALADTTTTEVTIEAKAIACGYSSSQTTDGYKNDGRIHLGGAYETGVLKSNHDITIGSEIVYNEATKIGIYNQGANRDANVSFLRFTLPAAVTDADTYTLTMTPDGYGHSSRTGAMDIYAGIADMEHEGVMGSAALTDSWTTITWATRPIVNNVTPLKTVVSIVPKTEVTLDLTDLLKNQSGTVTVALLSKANGTTASDSYFKDVQLTRTTTVTEPTFTNATKISPDAAEGETKDAVGFKCELSGVSGTVKSLTWKVTHDKKGTVMIERNMPELTISDTSTYIVGLLITDIEESDIDKLSAQAAIQ